MKEKENNLVVYQNEFIDRFLIDYKQKAIDVFFGIIMKVQQNSNIIEFDKLELKKLVKTGNLTNKEFGELIKHIASNTVRFKTIEEIIDEETGVILANPGDYVTINFFDILVEKEKEQKVVIKIKKEFKKYFFELKSELGFSSHKLKELLDLDSRYAKILFILLNRWKNYNKKVSIDFEFLKEYMKFPKSYKNNDIKRVLEKAKKNIEDNTNISYIFEFNRNGRKVESISFYVTNVKNMLHKKITDPKISEIEKKVLELAIKNREV